MPLPTFLQSSSGFDSSLAVQEGFPPAAVKKQHNTMPGVSSALTAAASAAGQGSGACHCGHTPSSLQSLSGKVGFRVEVLTPVCVSMSRPRCCIVCSKAMRVSPLGPLTHPTKPEDQQHITTKHKNACGLWYTPSMISNHGAYPPPPTPPPCPTKPHPIHTLTCLCVHVESPLLYRVLQGHECSEWCVLVMLLWAALTA
jgi:hypothetical protein